VVRTLVRHAGETAAELDERPNRKIDWPIEELSEEDRARVEQARAAFLEERDIDSLTKVMLEVYKPHPELFAEVRRRVQAAVEFPGYVEALHRALLSLSVGALEALVVGLLTQHYRLHPAAVSDLEFTLADLESIGSVDDARELAVTRKVETVSSGGLTQTSDWFDKNLGVGLEALAANADRFTELLQRRHVIMHNAGRVSTAYQRKAPDPYRNLPLGSGLRLDTEYVERAVDELSVVGNRLAMIAWSKWSPAETPALISLVTERLDGLLAEGRWVAVEAIARTLRSFDCSDRVKQIARVQEWHAIKQLHGLEEIEDDVRTWDTSALSPEFGVARALLLDDLDKAFARFGELSPDDRIEVATWALAAPMRNDMRWEADPPG
jgi:hypothetical protein